MRDIQTRSNPLSAPHNTNPQNASSSGVDTRTLADVFQRSLKTAFEVPGHSTKTQRQGDILQQGSEQPTNLATAEHTSDFLTPTALEYQHEHSTPLLSEELLTEQYVKDEKELLGAISTGIPTSNHEQLSQIQQGLSGIPTLSTANSLQLESSYNTASAIQAVSKLLEKLDQLHRTLGAKQWMFEWLNGTTVKLSLRVSRSVDGDYKATIGDYDSDLSRDQFIGELNQRLQEKKYQITVTREHD